MFYKHIILRTSNLKAITDSVFTDTSVGWSYARIPYMNNMIYKN